MKTKQQNHQLHINLRFHYYDGIAQTRSMPKAKSNHF